MNVKILRVSTDELVGATIRNDQIIELPSIQKGWRFNFDKQIKRLSYATAYVLVSEDTPKYIEFMSTNTDNDFKIAIGLSGKEWSEEKLANYSSLK